MIKHLASAILILAPLSFASADPYTNATTNAGCTAGQATASPPQRSVYYLKNLLQNNFHSPIKGEFSDATFANAYVNATPTMHSAAASAGWLYSFTMTINACPGQSSVSKSFMADDPSSIQHNSIIKSSTTNTAFHCTLETALNLNGSNTNTQTTWSGGQRGSATTSGNTFSQSCSTTLSCQIVETVLSTCQQTQ